jgi:hypothetical protein
VSQSPLRQPDKILLREFGRFQGVLTRAFSVYYLCGGYRGQSATWARRVSLDLFISYHHADLNRNLAFDDNCSGHSNSGIAEPGIPSANNWIQSSLRCQF